MIKLALANLILVIFLFPLGVAFAANEKISVEIKGMVCAFCAQGITSSFEKHGSISVVTVEIEKHAVILELKDGQEISDDEIKKVVKEAGYDVGKIER